MPSRKESHQRIPWLKVLCLEALQKMTHLKKVSWNLKEALSIIARIWKPPTIENSRWGSEIGKYKQLSIRHRRPKYLVLWMKQTGRDKKLSEVRPTKLGLRPSSPTNRNLRPYLRNWVTWAPTLAQWQPQRSISWKWPRPNVWPPTPPWALRPNKR